MKRFWLVLLSLGLIAAFSTAAMAVDVKVSGEFFVAGAYLDKTALIKDTGTSSALYYQRLRLRADLVVSPGLTLTTRADILDRQWGAARSASSSSTYNTATSVVTTTSAPNMYDSAGTRAENENIAFDWAYLTYVSPIGMFAVGAQNDYAWGTVFGDRSKPSLKITWTGLFGPVAVGAQIAQEVEGSRSAINVTGVQDADAAGFIAFAKYSFKAGAAGYLFRWNRNASNKTTAIGLTVNTFSHCPYFQVKLGPVALEGEANYTHGSYDYNHAAANPTAQIDSFMAYLNANANFGIAYVGGTFAFLNGQINPDEYGTSPNLNATRRTGILTGGIDWNPMLILWNYERSYQFGALNGAGTATNIADGTASTGMSNAWFFQVKGGVKPVEKLDINLAVSYANAVVKPAGYLYNDYGWEIDATATYKITNNLSYMLGGGYLFTGKYFKANVDGANLQDDYMLINKLTLTF